MAFCAIAAHGGRIVKTTGDGILSSEFLREFHC